MKSQLISSIKKIFVWIMPILMVVAIVLTAYFSYNLGSGRADGESQTSSNEHDMSAMEQEAPESQTIWTCSMHPQIQMNKPGKCPLCGMNLVPMTDDSDASSPRQLVMSAEARALAKIETSLVQRRWIDHEISMVGLVDYDETRLAYVTAYVGGRLDRLYVDSTGTAVRKGDHLVYLYSPQLLSTQEELIQARKAFDRLSTNSMKSMREATLKTLESTRERLRLWGITAEQIKAIEERGKREDHLTIYAKQDGIVIHKNTQEGGYVKTGDRIYTIADLSRLWVQLKAYESDLPWLHYGQQVTFTTVAHPGETFQGRISFIDPVLDPMTRTVNIRVNVDNSDRRLKPGMFASATVRARLSEDGQVIAIDLAGKWISPMHPEIIKDEAGQCDVCGMDLVSAKEMGFVAEVDKTPPLTVPASAALLTGKRAVVYLELLGRDKPTFEGREVVLGPRAGDYYLVLEGLKEGDRVVTRGSFRIDSALQILAKPSMMNPKGGGRKGSAMKMGSDDGPAVKDEHAGHSKMKKK